MKHRLIHIMLLVLVLVSCAVPAFAMTADEATAAGWTWSGGKITAYSGSDTDIIIPDEIDGTAITELGTDLFRSNTTITSVDIPEGVTTIGMRVFYGCTKLTDITLPSSIESIGNAAFYNSKITSVSLPNITTLGTAVFQNCTALTYAYIDGTIAKLPTGTFQNCTKLTDVTIPGTVTAIGDQAFYNCTSLPYVELQDTVTSIGASSFYGCTSLEMDCLPSDLLTIGAQAFFNCTALDVEIPDGVTTLGNYAFLNSGLTEVIIPDSVTSLGYGVFYGCTSLVSATLGTGVAVLPDYPSSGIKINNTTVYPGLFENCTALETVEIPEGITTIGIYCFKGCLALSYVSLPDTLTTVKSSAFYMGVKNNTGSQLTYIDFPDGLTTLGTYAFCGTALEEVNLPEGITTISEACFYGTNVTSVTLPSTVTKVADGAFNQCPSLRYVNLNDGLTSIGTQAFAGVGFDGQLKSVVVPESVTSIGYQPFGRCIVNVVFLGNISVFTKQYGSGTIGFASNCDQLTTITLPASLTRLELSTWGKDDSGHSKKVKVVNFLGTEEQWNSILKDTSLFSGAQINFECEVYKPNGDNSEVYVMCGDQVVQYNGIGDVDISEEHIGTAVTSIGQYAAYKDDDITTLTVSETVTEIEQYAFSQSSLESVVTSGDIGTSVFSHCESLVSAEIKNCTTIDEYAFYTDPLDTAIFPLSVTDIAAHAFTKLDGEEVIDDLGYEGTKKQWANVNIVFGEVEGAESNVPLKVKPTYNYYNPVYTVDEEYIVVIDSGIDVGDEPAEITVTGIVMNEDTELVVYVHSANDFALVNGDGDSLDYILTVDDESDPLVNGAAILTIPYAEYTEEDSFSISLYGDVLDVPIYAGHYTDTLSYTIEIVELDEDE